MFLVFGTDDVDVAFAADGLEFVSVQSSVNFFKEERGGSGEKK